MTKRLRSLHYKLVPLSETITVTEDATPLEVMLAGFRCVATGTGLTAKPTDDYGDASAAASVLQPALEAWSATSELIDITPIAFELEAASYDELDDQDNTTGDMAHVVGDVGFFTEAFAIAKNNLPEPRPDISIEGPTAAHLRRRWRNVVTGTESPVMVAYLVKTSVEDYVGRPQDVPDKLNISSKVWAQFSRIVSTDDPDYGRKAKGRLGPLTSDEVHWIKYAAPLIIRRVLEHEAGADISRRITKDDLPKPSQP